MTAIPDTLHVFFDSNVFLSLYDLTKSDLDEVEGLSNLIADGTVTLYLPRQVVDEVQRTRDSILAGVKASLDRATIKFPYPSIVKNEGSLCQQLRATTKRWNDDRNQVIRAVFRRINTKTLHADIVIHKLFASTKILDANKEIVDRARLRMDLRNPPGKTGSLGDAINWETLLSVVPDGVKLMIVSNDKDFSSELHEPKRHEPRIKSFLSQEWSNAKHGGSVVLHSDFIGFTDACKQVGQLKIEEARRERQNALVSRLVESGSFVSTHEWISALNQCFPFTPNNVERLVEALFSNEQIGWIHTDSDVSAFFVRLHTEHGHQIPDRLLDLFLEHYPQCKVDRLKRPPVSFCSSESA